MEPIASTGGVDPELLEARLAALENGATRARLRVVVDRALVALGKVQEVPVGALEATVSSYSTMALWSGVDDAVSAMWHALEALRSGMQPLVEAFEEKSDAGDDLGLVAQLDGPNADAVAVQPAAKLVLDDDTERIAETAWAMGFVLAGEVKEFCGRLPALLKLEDGWELVDALQGHIEHIRGALNAILGGVYSSLAGVGGESEDADRSFFLTASIELRSRVFQLRDAIGAIERRMKASAPRDWLELLVEASALVNEFIFGPGFAWARATDKRTFLAQRQSLSGILELYSPLRAGPARRAVEDLARFLDALEVINQRECLVLHDHAALSRVVASMREAAAAGGQTARDAIGRGLAALSEASGRDRELDRMLAEAMAPGGSVPVNEILTRAEALVGMLGSQVGR
jgi:hypothetical protein